SHKAETDANFENLSLILLENDDAMSAAFGTHNVRSIAHVMAQSERLGIEPRNFEFQMLYGMADAIKSALLALDLRVREYCPVGELLPGMAYLVRRLLENTSNEGFLANKFAKGASRAELLRNPEEPLSEIKEGAAIKKTFAAPGPPHPGPLPKGEGVNAVAFTNEPPTDFTVPEEREKIACAIAELRKDLGQKHPLARNNKRVP